MHIVPLFVALDEMRPTTQLWGTAEDFF
jgi:hypothetical protein